MKVYKKKKKIKEITKPRNGTCACCHKNTIVIPQKKGIGAGSQYLICKKCHTKGVAFNPQKSVDKKEADERTELALQMMNELKEYYNLSPERLGNRLGLYRSYYSNIKNKTCRVSVEKFAVIKEKYQAMLKEESIAYDDKLLKDTWEGDEEIEDD